MQLTATSFRMRTAGARSSRRRRAGTGSWRALSACCLLAALLLYGAAPLATLWRAADGIRRGDADTLRTALDWNRVRDGLKQDLGASPALALAGATTSGTARLGAAHTVDASAADDELPAFGESFATNVVSHAIDDQMTPENLVTMLSAPGASGGTGWRRMLSRIGRLDFTGPARFEASFRMSDDPNATPLLVSLQLSRWHWRITRIHLPDDGTATTVRTDRT